MTGLGDFEMPDPTRQSRSGRVLTALRAPRQSGGVEPALEQDRRGHRVDHLPPALATDTAFDQGTLGDGGRETLIPQLDRDRGPLPKLGGERSRVLGCIAFIPIETTGHPITTRSTSRSSIS